MATIEANAHNLSSSAKDFDSEVAATQAYFDSPRFEGITRLYSARQVVEQRGTIATDHTVAREAAEAFHPYLRELFAQKKSITTFGPYSPGQAVVMKRMGIGGIYLGGWATSAKGSISEDPGPDLASYPLSQVPDEAAGLVRALLTADRNQHYLRLQMTPEQREAQPPVDYRPFIIADADTGHGGDPHVRNLIRRFVESGVPGYHIEDQRPGTKKCGHQGGKVLVPSDEQIKRLNTARFQLDIMRVPGIIVARTDAEAANLIDSRADERDQPFLLGVTNLKIPSYKSCFLAMMRRFYDQGLTEINGHLLYDLPEGQYEAAEAWLTGAGIMDEIAAAVESWTSGAASSVDALYDAVESKFVDAWQDDAGLNTYGEAVAEVIEFREREGESVAMSAAEWREFATRAPLYTATNKARELGVDVAWDCEPAKTPEGYYQVRGGIPYAIAKSLAAAPFADILWMETKTADLADAKQFADAIHAVYPDQMLAYNLSPSFNWDTTGMTDDEMRAFPEELGKMGFVFNFITYGGHQVDGVACEEFATSLRQEGMLALARLQRKMRLVESPYRTPQTLVGGPRSDAALAASSGRTATTKAMGKGSTQHQHLVQTEVPKKLLEEWLAMWSEHYGLPEKLHVQLRPRRAGSDVLDLQILGEGGDGTDPLANVVVDPIKDRHGRSILTVRDQNTFAEQMRKKRLMDLIHLWLIHRFKAEIVYYVTPTEDNIYQTEKMKAHGIFSDVYQEVGEIIVADVNKPRIEELLASDREALGRLIRKED
ncbi:isocitrate lyase ICL2 [Mycolicibacterium smegmatis]|jgi:isocitrate lyase|uniref:isocitrate lyase n=2 Tax=Mycolicibacterium smegmatis (strain ATCC 700084 / mc(2)155) TaxID=246196 RepID=A0QYL9_MYCS2|nr:isocitrate lyase ICL2 [Mycolicibacterium smegmatis]ABK73184.1 isocitrate lyase [Mycolicibacterium smegmatis MC2 155]AFP40081.1 putative isocitrate lyase aceab second part (isocitrase) (isocitratase) [Mycolicibacterium smegmatis MC2 155]AIU08833.1 isocitrate lyase [Mycolicibacterium smegmatis MC2 155]AIU15458.1 isocitrate lyase [Mycolicibacterium smegmatis]AIU22081.1 isocitrate lyase [Mycolicibacterium smegmatis]